MRLILLLAAAAFAQPQSTDSAFQKEIAEKNAQIKEQAEKSRKALQTDKAAKEERERARKAAAGDYRIADVGSTLKPKRTYKVNTLMGRQPMESLVSLLYEEGAVFDTLRYVRVSAAGADLAVWHAEGLFRADLPPHILENALKSCEGLDDLQFLRVLDNVTAAVAETNPSLATIHTIGTHCKNPDDIMGARGPRTPDPNDTPHQGERKGDNRPIKPSPTGEDPRPSPKPSEFPR